MKDKPAPSTPDGTGGAGNQRLSELVVRDLANRLATEIANHAVTRAQAQLDRAEIAAIKQQLEQLQKPAAKTQRKKK